MPKAAYLLWFLGLLVGSGLVVSGVAAQDAAIVQPSRQRAEKQVAAWLERQRDRPPVVRALVQRMPKGGDNHTHLSGAVYAERYLAWAAADGYCVDLSGDQTGAPQDCGALLKASDRVQ